ncbi:MAG: rpmC [Candidatus Saccharibacteria bacterium]|nr:rpmC [Candidatus Saccharibacteria bacterium]
MADKKTVVKTTKTVEPAAPLTLEQLREKLTSSLQEQLDSKRSHVQGELVNPHVLTVKRKEIARLQTAIRQLEIAAAKENK